MLYIGSAGHLCFPLVRCTYMRLVCHACALTYVTYSTNAHTYIHAASRSQTILGDYAEYIIRVRTRRRESASRVLRVVVVLRAVLHCMDRGTCLQYASWKQGVEPTYVHMHTGPSKIVSQNESFRF